MFKVFGNILPKIVKSNKLHRRGSSNGTLLKSESSLRKYMKSEFNTKTDTESLKSV